MSKRKRRKVENEIEATAPPPGWFVGLTRHRSKLFYGLAVVALLVVLGVRLAARQESRGHYDYLQAQTTLRQLMQERADETTALAELEGILQRHGELHAKYDGPLAQVCLKQEQPEAAREYARPLLKRTSAMAGAYAEFSQGSLLLAEGHYPEALKQTQELQEQIDQAKAPLLHAHTLLRIALLQGEIGSAGEERVAWERLLEAVEQSDARQLFLQAYTSGSITLTDYAQARLRLLSVPTA